MHERPILHARWASTLALLILTGAASPASSAPSDLAAGLAQEARALLDAGRPAAAVERIEARAPADTRDADTWSLLAESYHALMDDAGLLKKRGFAKEMKRALETALELDPDHVDARQQLVDFHHYAPWIVGGDKGEAARHLAELERVAPAVAHATRGDHARNAGDFEAARDHYRKAVETGALAPMQRLAYAVIEQQLDNYEASLRLLDEVISAAPDLERAYYYRARASAMAALDIERGLECAEHYLDHCRDCDDDDRGFGWWRRATLLKRLDRRAEAIAAYREALRLNPELEGARKGLAGLAPERP